MCVCMCDKRDNAHSSLIRPSCVINYTVRLFFTPSAENDIVDGRKNKYRREKLERMKGETVTEGEEMKVKMWGMLREMEHQHQEASGEEDRGEKEKEAISRR